MGGKGQDFCGTYIKDTWTKPNGVGSRGLVPIAGLGELMGGKWSQLYLNNKKNVERKCPFAFPGLLSERYRACRGQIQPISEI